MGKYDWAEASCPQQVSALLTKPLSADDAVQVALLNSPQLKADFYALQIAEADVVQAGRLPNPKFGMLYARNNGDYKIEQILTFNIFALLTMPQATAVEKKCFAAAKNAASLQVLYLAHQTRKAYFNALGALERVKYLTKVKTSAEATAEFAKRIRTAGNFNKLELAREQTYYSEAVLDLAQADNHQL